MICKCGVQMHQLVRNKKPIGLGASSEGFYKTQELKECPGCGTLVLETYIAKEVSEDFVKKYIKVGGG